MDRRFGLIMATTALTAAACGSSSSSAPGSASAAPTTAQVQIDGKADAFNAEFTAYFPNEVKVHPGDSVNFTSVFRGEPHSVVLGSLVQTGLDAYDKLQAAAGPQGNVDDHQVPELAKIPDMLPRGPGDANQATAQPCFLTSGDPPGPGAIPCPPATQPDFSGTESVYSSGFLPDAATFTVKLASSLKPGTYRYMCALHRSGMTGKLTVVGSSTAIPSAADNKKAGDDQLGKKTAALQPEVDKATQGTPPTKPVAGVVSMDPAFQDSEANIFAPKDITLALGGSATWTILGAHTIAFNAPQDATPILNKLADGSVHTNPKAGAPAGNKGVPPPSGPPAGSSPSAAASPSASGSAASGSPGGFTLPPPTVVDLGKVPATGFWNTGLILSFPDPTTPGSFKAVKLTFPTAGTYSYKCLVHPDMEGTVKVG